MKLIAGHIWAQKIYTAVEELLRDLIGCIGVANIFLHVRVTRNGFDWNLNAVVIDDDKAEIKERFVVCNALGNDFETWDAFLRFNSVRD